MKLLLIISTLTLSAYITGASYSSDTCAWSASVSEAIGKLTQSGQKTVQKELKDFQLYIGAALQPVYEYLGEEYKNEIASVNATDSVQLAKLGGFLGIGNYTFGAGPQADLCANAKKLEALVSGFQQQNQATVWKILGGIGDAIKIIYKPLMAVVYVNNYEAVNNLFKTESLESLVALGKVFGYE